MNPPKAHPALYYEKFTDGKVRCHLCPFHCLLKNGKLGVCRAKKNVSGNLIATTYGLTTSFNYDPVEKKPLYHFYPGRPILSVGPNSCNLDCTFCQNYQISQMEYPTRYVSPDDLAEAAGGSGSIGVAYTYTEPLMWYEYVHDSAIKVRKKGLKTVLVTNAYLEPKPFDDIIPLIDAMNIDIKSMDEEFYRKICRGKLPPILRNVESAVGKTHVEITNLVIPGLNDRADNFERLADFLAGLDPMIPLHLSRYHPAYKMNYPPTTAETLLKGAEIARKKLKHVYIGNILLEDQENTYCPSCGSLLVGRDGYFGIDAGGVKDGLCLECGARTNIIGV